MDTWRRPLSTPLWASHGQQYPRCATMNPAEVQSCTARFDPSCLCQLPHWHIALVYPTIIRIGWTGCLAVLHRHRRSSCARGRFQANRVTRLRPGCAGEVAILRADCYPRICRPTRVRPANGWIPGHPLDHGASATLFPNPLQPQILDQPELIVAGRTGSDQGATRDAVLIDERCQQRRWTPSAVKVCRSC